MSDFRPLDLVLLLLAAASVAAQRSTSRVSVSSTGAQSAGTTTIATVSDDGRWVVFVSDAGDLVLGDGNGRRDVFLRDRASGTTELISVGLGGTPGNGHAGSFAPAISADGRYVAFESAASNLVAGDTNGVGDVFVRDRVAATTERISVATGGDQGNGSAYSLAMSADGGVVVFQSAATNMVGGDANGKYDIFVRDRVSGTTSRVSRADGGGDSDNHSTNPAISADGRFVAFDSRATNLVAGDDNFRSDVFVYEIATDTMRLVSVDGSGSAAGGDSYNPSVSGDGRLVAFESGAANLIGGGDTNDAIDVFVTDWRARTTARYSVGAAGEGNGTSYEARISQDGRWLAFTTAATNLVPGDSNGVEDVLVAEISSFGLRRVSVSSSGAQGDARSMNATVGAGGRVIALRSEATNLVAGDSNGRTDAFVHVVDPPASYTPFGHGCAGTVGVPILEPTIGRVPYVGAPFEVALRNVLPGSTVLWLTGFDRLPPFDLGWFGMPGCVMFVSPQLVQQWTVPGPILLVPFPIPNDVNLAGLTFYHQAAVLDRGANSAGIVLSNAGEGVVGW
ncbi:MAG: hypothetical protein R3F56_24705 [Planctomycetota bacterium]